MERKIQDIKKGDCFTRKPDNDGRQHLFIRGEYCRETKRYICTDFNDINRVIYLPKNKIVYTD